MCKFKTNQSKIKKTTENAFNTQIIHTSHVMSCLDTRDLCFLLKWLP